MGAESVFSSPRPAPSRSSSPSAGVRPSSMSQRRLVRLVPVVSRRRASPSRRNGSSISSALDLPVPLRPRSRRRPSAKSKVWSSYCQTLQIPARLSRYRQARSASPSLGDRRSADAPAGVSGASAASVPAAPFPAAVSSVRSSSAVPDRAGAWPFGDGAAAAPSSSDTGAPDDARRSVPLSSPAPASSDGDGAEGTVRSSPPWAGPMLRTCRITEAIGSSRSDIDVSAPSIMLAAPFAPLPLTGRPPHRVLRRPRAGDPARRRS
ncbi:hypothetical protein NOGI109294_26870 [Nocardiopsis gilva]